MKIGERFKVPKTTSGGIYAIVNTDDCKIYIGQTENINRRAKAHLEQLRKGTHTNKELQKDAEKNLYFLVLHFAENKEMLSILECVYMLQAINKDYELYNIQGNSGRRDIEKKIVYGFLRLLKTSDKFDKSFVKHIGRKPADVRHSKRMKDLYEMKKNRLRTV